MKRAWMFPCAAGALAVVLWGATPAGPQWIWFSATVGMYMIDGARRASSM